MFSDLPLESVYSPSWNLLRLGGPAGIRVDDGDRAELRARRADGLRVVGRVGEVEEVGHALGRLLGERDHDLRVVQGRGRVLHGDRHAVARHRRVDLPAFPLHPLPLGVALAAPFAFDWQFGHVGFRRARALDGDRRGRRRLVGVDPREAALRVRRA